MKIVFIPFLTFIFSCISVAFGAAALSDHLDELHIIDTIMGNRRTNVGCHQTLYPVVSMPLVVNCHPYNPTDVAGSNAPSYVSHPLVVRYNADMARAILPEFIKAKLDAAGPTCQVFLNVQDNPWNGTLIQLRPHAFSDFFPAMGGNYQGVSVFVCRGDGAPLLNETGAVHLHDGVASPSNFVITGLNYTHGEDFYSIVTYQGKTVITRHILLTVPDRERFQDFLCASAVQDRSPSFFLPLLGADYVHFLKENGIN